MGQSIMSLSRYLNLENRIITEEENRYDYFPHDYEITKISFDHSCLKDTLKIAKFRTKNISTKFLEKNLFRKRMLALNAYKSLD